MQDLFSGLNKMFENRVRLGIMSVLMVNKWVDFNTLKNNLKVTDGNLASHLNTLENKQMIDIKKQFVGRKPKTSYKVTAKGEKAFKNHLNALEKILKQTKSNN